MPINQSVKERLLSYPIKVVFAGFQSNTLALAQAGWDMSAEQYMTDFGRFHLRLAMRHGDKNHAMYLMTHPLEIPMGEVFGRGTRVGDEDFLLLYKYLDSLVFSVAYANSDITFKMMAPMRGMTMLNSFHPVDMRPTLDRGYLEERISDFKFFKVVKDDKKEIIVDPAQVPELLDLILKAQSKTQKEIRARDRSRENLQAYRDGSMFTGKPAHEVEAQIITLVG